jgi:hypothetical protein
LLKKAIAIAAEAIMHAKARIPPTMMAVIITAFVREPLLVSLIEDLHNLSETSFAQRVAFLLKRSATC